MTKIWRVITVNAHTTLDEWYFRTRSGAMEKFEAVADPSLAPQPQGSEHQHGVRAASSHGIDVEAYPVELQGKYDVWLHSHSYNSAERDE